MPDAARTALRYLPLVAVCALIAGAGAYALAHGRVRYTATATMAVSNAKTAETLISSTSAQPDASGGGTGFVTSQVPVVTSAVVLRRAERLLGGGRSLGGIAVSPNVNAQTIAVSAVSGDRGTAVDSANAVVKAYRDYRRTTRAQVVGAAAASLRDQVASLRDAAARLRRRQDRASARERSTISTQRQAAETRYQDAYSQQQDLEAQARVASSGATAVSPAISARPSSVRRLGLLGAVLGALVAALLCLLRERASGVVRKTADVEEETGLSVLSDVPRVARRHRRRLASARPDSKLFEAMRRVRVNLRLIETPDAPIRSVLVASADREEGKSFVAANLAASWAASGSRVLLMSTDVRRPRVERLVARGADDATVGLAELLLDPSLDPKGPIVATDVDGLSLLPVGAARAAAVDGLQTDRFTALLTHLRDEFDVIVLDSPPLLSVSDALVLARVADVTLLVAAADRSRRSRIALAREALAGATPARVFAVVNRDATARTAQRYVPREAPAESAAPLAGPPAA